MADDDESGAGSLTQQAEGAAPAGGASRSGKEPGGARLERMQKQLEKAVEEEDYERAAELRDEIEKLEDEEE